MLDKLPPEHKARWFAEAAFNLGEQSMMSVMSTAMSRLNSFLDTELEQLLCFDTEIDAEKFCNEKSAVFIVLPEKDSTKYFMVSLIIQQLYREILAVADENGGNLKNRVMMYMDELKSMPKGHFIVMKTGHNPMKVKLKLFFKWGIKFEEPFSLSEKESRKVKYADKRDLESAINEQFDCGLSDEELQEVLKRTAQTHPPTRVKTEQQAVSENKKEEPSSDKGD